MAIHISNKKVDLTLFSRYVIRTVNLHNSVNFDLQIGPVIRSDHKDFFLKNFYRKLILKYLKILSKLIRHIWQKSLKKVNRAAEKKPKFANKKWKKSDKKSVLSTISPTQNL